MARIRPTNGAHSRRFRGPTRVVRGEPSDLPSCESVEAMKPRGRQVSAVEIAGVGHAPTFVHKDQIAIAQAFFCGDDLAFMHQPAPKLQ